MNTRWLILVSLAVGLVACDKSASSSSSGAPSASTTAAVTASAPSATPTAPSMNATAENDPLPSHTDVAKTVRGEVTKQNYKTELEKLEKSADEP